MSKKNRKTRLGRVLMKRKREDSDNEGANESEQPPPPVRSSDEPIPKKRKWVNRQRVLVFAARGTTQRDRHLMNNLKSVMPHSKDENKISRREHLAVINELCAMKNCNKSVFFEARKKQDLYAWISNVPNGPCAKFLVQNIITMQELRMTGNCLKGSRPLLSFDANFSQLPHLALLKELFIQVFGVPNHHPKSQPFVDRVISFAYLDNRIWYRHYQILKEDGALAEIGPRFILNPIKIFDSSFTGNALWENKHYVTPNLLRKQIAAKAGMKYVNRKFQKERAIASKLLPKTSFETRPEDEIFEGDALVKAAEVVGEELPEDVLPSEKNEERQKDPIVSFKKPKRGGVKKRKAIANAKKKLEAMAEKNGQANGFQVVDCK
ncbi:ribosome biogenesis protein BRX1 homolog isoform X1 [Cimex lectularius]|uniref:Ribosome biogenesis protein BRX1 homolog n=2 Tax=Cimex lectularius TaxID=79782 RepID=A0A8I6SBB5_CIMLE|nr:ribosome biogenesis protein BRX1 homolog isoform X1 [Cimex lectularius]